VNISSTSAIAALFLAYLLTGSLISSLGQKIAAAADQHELILPMISQMVLGSVGMAFIASLIIAIVATAVLILLAKSENHQSRFLTALTMSWVILLGGLLFALLGFTLPIIKMLE